MRQKLINRFYRFLRMIGIVETNNGNMNDFYEKALKIAKSRGSDYVSVKVEFNTHQGYSFTSYYHGSSLYTDVTPEKSLDKLSNGLKIEVSHVENVIF